MEHLISYIGFSMRKSGAAFSYDCGSDNMKLHLILMGENIQGICSEVQKYIQLLRLPEGSTVAIFTGDSLEPQDIGRSDEMQSSAELFSCNGRSPT
jgi:hypothetical protein